MKGNCFIEFCFLPNINMNHPWVYICTLPLDIFISKSRLISYLLSKLMFSFLPVLLLPSTQAFFQPATKLSAVLSNFFTFLLPQPPPHFTPRLWAGCFTDISFYSLHFCSPNWSSQSSSLSCSKSAMVFKSNKKKVITTLMLPYSANLVFLRILHQISPRPKARPSLLLVNHTGLVNFRFLIQTHSISSFSSLFTSLDTHSIYPALPWQHLSWFILINLLMFSTSNHVPYNVVPETSFHCFGSIWVLQSSLQSLS